MHKRLVATVLAIAGLLAISGTTLSAQEKTESKGAYKVGVVNRALIFDQYSRKKDLLSELEVDVKKIEADLQAKLDKLEADQEAYRAKRDSLTEDQRALEEDKLNGRYDELKAEKAQVQADIDRKGDRVIRQVKTDIDGAITKIGVRDNYHLILEADPAPAARSSVVFFSDTLDLTQQVVDLLNGEYKKEG